MIYNLEALCLGRGDCENNPIAAAKRGERMMSFYLCALLIGVVAGLRAMTAPTAISWAAYLRWLPLDGTPLSFLGATITPYLFTLAAIAELITDQLPTTPSRKAPLGFGARIVTGTLSGCAIGMAGGSWVFGAVAGAIGAVIGTLGGAAARQWMATAFGRDRPAALLEDIVAIGGAFAIILFLK
jgi:uncharacterized membrane protein